MKITSNRPLHTKSVHGRRRASATREENFSGQLADKPAAVGAPPSTAPLSAVEGVLAAQEVPAATDGRSRGLKRGYNILDHLDDIRLGLLSGSFTRNRLADLGREIKATRDAEIDPRLSAILDDIELRAAVELAKLDRVL